jgi:hypothetical protein
MIPSSTRDIQMAVIGFFIFSLSIAGEWDGDIYATATSGRSRCWAELEDFRKCRYWRLVYETRRSSFLIDQTRASSQDYVIRSSCINYVM